MHINNTRYNVQSFGIYHSACQLSIYILFNGSDFAFFIDRDIHYAINIIFRIHHVPPFNDHCIRRLCVLSRRINAQQRKKKEY
jgi:hypothetical protein